MADALEYARAESRRRAAAIEGAIREADRAILYVAYPQERWRTDDGEIAGWLVHEPYDPEKTVWDMDATLVTMADHSTRDDEVA